MRLVICNYGSGIYCRLLQVDIQQTIKWNEMFISFVWRKRSIGLQGEIQTYMCVPLWRSDAGIHFPKRTIREKIPSEAIFPSTHFITLHIIDNLRVFLFSFYGRRFTVQRKSFFHAHHVYISQFIISICSFVRTFCNTKNA